MSSFRGFLKLFFRKAIKVKDARGVHASHCVDSSPGLFRHSANDTLSNFKPFPDSPATPRVNINLFTCHGFLQLRALHASLQACQMSQPEGEEPGSSSDSGEAPASASVEAAASVESTSGQAVSDDNAAQGHKPIETTKGVLAPIVPGMPVVHRGAPAAIVGQSLSIHGLVKEMTDRIRRRLFEEAIQIYRQWLQCIDPVTGKPNKPLVTPCNIALLAEGLKGAPVDVLLKRVEEMNRLGLAPNTDFLRAV